MKDAVDRSPAAAAPSSTPMQVEATDRAFHNKESQSRESSFLGGIVDASPPLAPTAAAPAPALSAQPSLSLFSPSSNSPATPVAGQHGTSPSKSRFSSVRFPDGMEGQTASFKRSPIKVGYLFKQSSGSWKRKRWNQRWFVLDTEMGILKYFRHESLPEAVPFRQDAHGVIHLKEPGASLVIQGDLPRNVPTPFCFTVFDGNRSFLMCADSNQEFREWTSAISAILSPRKLTADGMTPGSPNATTSRRASTDSALDRAVSLPVVSTQVVTQTATKEDDERAPSSSLTTRDIDALATSTHKSDARPSLQQTAVALAVFNSVAVIVRYGSVECLYASLLGVNAFFVWALWFQKPSVRPVSSLSIHGDDDNSAASASDTSSSGVAGQPLPSSPRGRDSKSSQPDSPRKATLPRLEKLPSASFQPTKFLGTINGIKAKAGDSVKMCPPAPAAIVTGCWTQISGTRFQVRQGPNYRKTKHKAPSEESLLELLAIDIYRSPSKIDNVASIVDLGGLKPENSPLDLFIVNCQVPSYQPSNPLWGEKQGNGEGFNFVSYFAISPEIRQQLKEHEPGDQAVRLLKNFMQDNSSVRDRFKAIGIVVNPQEQKQLGRTERHLLETYNGQPILTRPQHRFYRGDGYFEVDVDAHEFNYVARKGLAGVSDHFRNMVVDFGFVLEGQDDLELPEQMLGCVRLCKIDVRQALEIT